MPQLLNKLFLCSKRTVFSPVEPSSFYYITTLIQSTHNNFMNKKTTRPK